MSDDGLDDTTTSSDDEASTGHDEPTAAAETGESPRSSDRPAASVVDSMNGPSPEAIRRFGGVGTSAARSLLIPTLAVIIALVIGAFIIAFSDVDNVPLLFESPGEALSNMVNEVGRAYKALFIGAFGSVTAISETLLAATPLLLAGLGVALGFRAALFNIGAQGQMLMGAVLATWVGVNLGTWAPLHVVLTLLAAFLGGLLWGAIPGLLKATTGAHEVITTIMFNFIAVFFMQWLLSTPFLQDPDSTNPISAAVETSARLPTLFGSGYRVTIGFLIAVAAVGAVHWLLFRSSIGFELRAVGSNPSAGKYAGMNVPFLITLAMALAGALAGLAGGNQVAGLSPYKATQSIAGSIGFDSITVALLGRSNPIGVMWAAILFGALSAGGREMQAAASVPLDLVVVLQALIVIFVAAPNIVRAIFRLRDTGSTTTVLSKGWGG